MTALSPCGGKNRRYETAFHDLRPKRTPAHLKHETPFCVFMIQYSQEQKPGLPRAAMRTPRELTRRNEP